MNQEVLRNAFEYANGQLLWKHGAPGKSKGKSAGTLRPDGRYALMVEGNRYLRSRAIWIWHNGEIPDGLDIDHINTDKSDDKIENLRLATRSQNLQNVVRKKGKGSVYKGVTFCKKDNLWMARLWLTETKKFRYLGWFKTEEEAAQCYAKAATKYSSYILLTGT